MRTNNSTAIMPRLDIKLCASPSLCSASASAFSFSCTRNSQRSRAALVDSRRGGRRRTSAYYFSRGVSFKSILPTHHTTSPRWNEDPYSLLHSSIVAAVNRTNHVQSSHRHRRGPLARLNMCIRTQHQRRPCCINLSPNGHPRRHR